MPVVDLPIEQLREYRSPTPEPSGFDDFWARTLAENAAFRGAELVPVETGLRLLRTYDVRYEGYGGAPVRGWLHLPVGVDEPVPAVVQFLGYGGGRGLAHEETLWAQAGFAHFVMDTRGQGAVWRVSDTDDPDPAAGAVGTGRLTRGIRSADDYVYRRIFVDAVHAVRLVAAQSFVDPARIVVAGKSQGGGIALAAAALAPERVAAAMVDVPFLSHFRRAAQIATSSPYLELQQFLKLHRDDIETVFATLDHFDGVAFASRASAPALFSVGLMDTVCPPSTVFAAYNAYAGPKRMVEYPFNEHEGGGEHHVAAQLAWLHDLLGT